MQTAAPLPPVSYLDGNPIAGGKTKTPSEKYRVVDEPPTETITTTTTPTEENPTLTQVQTHTTATVGPGPTLSHTLNDDVQRKQPNNTAVTKQKSQKPTETPKTVFAPLNKTGIGLSGGCAASVDDKRFQQARRKAAAKKRKQMKLSEGIKQVEDPTRPLLPKLKLKSPNAQKEMSERLYNAKSRIATKYSPEQLAELGKEKKGNPFLTPSHNKKLEDHEGLVNRLFYTEVKRRQQRRDQLYEKHNQVEPDKVLSMEAMQDSVARLHDAAMESKRETLEALVEGAYQYEEERVLTTEELEESIHRIYYDPVEVKKAALAKLTEKYSFKRESPIYAAVVSLEHSMKSIKNRLHK
eukprot:TRINITY_DN58333_c0_g1_i1.p1 TRINITY_DN58333_c0_g1~~TRINITY_DN58333_c0_g1_i1.p1  ORF type:complete len:353 (-),score=39.33 TRINITY_DN58333_c0_g1_i1:89-1147(-)